VGYAERRGGLRRALAVGPQPRAVRGVEGDDGVAVVWQVQRELAGLGLGLDEQDVRRVGGDRPGQAGDVSRRLVDGTMSRASARPSAASRTATIATFEATAGRTRARRAAVTTPSVPSLPTSRPARS
jgi:hypothetical protein